jgi:hypothetical protein
MLQTDTVSKYTLELLNKIGCHQQFNDSFLVGGTALTLQIDTTENQPDCEMLMDVDWNDVKQKIEKETVRFL